MNKKKIAASLLVMATIPTNVFADVDYTVQKGDSYWKISQSFNTTLQSVLQVNNATSSSNLDVGMLITVPSNTYTVQKGDTYYIIAKKCSVDLDELLKVNGVTDNTDIYPGQKIKIPDSRKTYELYTVKSGDTYWKISQKYKVSLNELLSFNNVTGEKVLYVGDTVKIPLHASENKPEEAPYITYSSHIVKNGDTLWNIAIQYGIPYSELLDANSLNESSYIYSGMKLIIPVHHIPVKNAPDGYGELLSWYEEAQYVIPINTDFTIVDLETGKSFNARRTVGSGHADCEPLTTKDTEKMKEIWGGSFNWNKRSVLVKYNGRTIAASAAGMLHAGNDGANGGVWTEWRSDGYGAGINYDYIKGNNAHGHFDLHFYKSVGHSSGVENETHQKNVLKSAGKA